MDHSDKYQVGGVTDSGLFSPEIILFFCLVASLGFHNFENSGDHLSSYLSTNDIWMFVDAESSRRGKMVGTKI